MCKNRYAFLQSFNVSARNIKSTILCFKISTYHAFLAWRIFQMDKDQAMAYTWPQL